MFSTLNKDKKRIYTKYHDPKKPFDHFDFMNYHGSGYHKSTGLNMSQLRLGIKRLARASKALPRPVIKAKLLEYVLDNTRFFVNSYDYFIGIYAWGREISDYTVYKWDEEVNTIKKKAEKDICREGYSAGTAIAWLDFDHTVPNWDDLLELGFPGILKRLEDAYKNIPNPTDDQTAIYQSMHIAYTAVIRFIDRVYQYAKQQTFEKAPKIAECLKTIRDGAPKTTYEALQLMYIYFIVSECIDHYQVRSLGYGLDQTLYSFFVHDVDDLGTPIDEVNEYIGYFLMQFAAMDNYWGQPFYLGGTSYEGRTLVNHVSYFILDVYKELGIYNPKIQIKYDDATPKEFMEKIIKMMQNGQTSFAFCSNDAIVKSLMSRGSTYESAFDSVISGCYEFKKFNGELGISTVYYNLLKPVSLVLDNGLDTITNKQVGIKTGEISQLKTFEDFYSAYLKQLEYMVERVQGAMTKLEEEIPYINPPLMYSATFESCVKPMKSAMDGGVNRTADILIIALASAVDSLMAIYRLVYDLGEYTLQDFKDAIDANWVGYDKLHRRVLTLKEKYGNNNKLADMYASSISKKVTGMFANRKNAFGDEYTIEAHAARSYLTFGNATKATPDGRMYGEEVSKNASPAQGKDKNGCLSLIKSVTSFDCSMYNRACCLDVMLHPTTVSGTEGIDVIYGLLETYRKLGGSVIQFNIFSVDQLKDAQIHPEKYQNLQVRVCGWNILWNNMCKKEQDEFIKRAENL